MAKRSKVELYEQIRKSHERDELSIRALAEHFGVHRRTVREALASPIPPPRKQSERPAPALGPWKPIIDGWLADDRGGPEEAAPHGPADLAAPGRRARGRRSPSPRCATTWPWPRDAVRSSPAEVMVPQTHPLGYEAEVDFGAVSFFLAAC